MGTFLGNTFVRADDALAVADAVRRTFAPQGIWPWYVAPPAGGWVGVFEQGLEGAAELAPGIAAGLSEALQTTAVSFQIYDGDFLAYIVAEHGRVVDRFHAKPGYMSLPPTREEQRRLKGDPKALAAACGRPEAESVLRAAFRRHKEDAEGLLEAIGIVLGIPGIERSHRHLAGPPDYIAIAPGELKGALTLYSGGAQEPATGAGEERPGLPVVDVPWPRGGAGLLWHVPVKPLVAEAMGPRWRQMMLKMFAEDFALEDPGDETYLWLDEPQGGGTVAWYFSFTSVDNPLWDRLDAVYDDLGFAPAPELPRSAVPMMGRRSDGTLVRLWPPPGPDVAGKQTIKGELVAKFTWYNRCYRITP
jgi:hypothetical protein